MKPALNGLIVVAVTVIRKYMKLKFKPADAIDGLEIETDTPLIWLKDNYEPLVIEHTVQLCASDWPVIEEALKKHGFKIVGK